MGLIFPLARRGTLGKPTLKEVLVRNGEAAMSGTIDFDLDSQDYMKASMGPW